MFLIHRDQAQPGQRREHRQAGAEQHIAVGRGQPVFRPLFFAQPAVQGHDATARKACAEMAFELRREGDFGDEDQGLPAGREAVCDQVQVKLGLATAGDAVDEVYAKAVERWAHGFERGELIRREHGPGCGRRRVRDGGRARPRRPASGNQCGGVAHLLVGPQRFPRQGAGLQGV